MGRTRECLVALVAVLGTAVTGSARAEQGGTQFQVTVDIVPHCIRHFELLADGGAISHQNATVGCEVGEASAHLTREQQGSSASRARVEITDLPAGAKRITTTHEPLTPGTETNGRWRMAVDF